MLSNIHALLFHNSANLCELKFIIHKLKKAFPAFSGIQNYLYNLERTINRKDSIRKFFKILIIQNVFTVTFSKNALPYLKKKKNILTISNSKTVFEILTRLASVTKLSVFICESRPKYEGRIIAEKLASRKIKTQLITEAQAQYI